jgi:hypothetical protein
MEVVSIHKKIEEKRKQDMLSVLDEMRRQIDSGDIVEFVAASIDATGDAQIHVCAMDLPGSIGLFEIGKHLLIQTEV